MDAKDLIAQGIMAAKRNQKDKAREMFNLALVTDPRNEHAWLWLSTVAIDDAEKEDCLRQVLAINPGNANAANELQKLSEKRRGELSATVAALGAARSANAAPKVAAAAVPVYAAAGSPTVVRKVSPRRRGGRAQMPGWAKLLIIGGFGFLILLIALGSYNLVTRVLNPVTPTITLTPSLTSTIPPTWTFTPTWTPTACPPRVCTATPTNTPTITLTPSDTPTITPSATPTSTATRTPTRTLTPTRTPTDTRTPTSTPTPTVTRTPTATATSSSTATKTASATTTRTLTRTVTRTLTATPAR